MDHFTLFYKRLTQLRNKQGISARDMSLSLGQSESYINKIENGKALPSWVLSFISVIFWNSSERFFDESDKNPATSQELTEKFMNLTTTQQEHLLFLIDDLLTKDE